MSDGNGLQQKNEQLSRQVATLQRENQLLRQKLDALIRHYFGPKSEKLDPNQLLLLLKGEETLSEEPDEEEPRNVLPFPKKPKGAPRRIVYPEDLREVREYEDPPEVLADPQAWRLISQQESVQLDYQPGEFIKRVLVRRKYVDLKDRSQAPVIAPMPPRLIQGSLASPRLLAQILISKYADHLPLYRQEMIFWQRHRVLIPRQQMVQWIDQCAQWLQPIYRKLQEQMR